MKFSSPPRNRCLWSEQKYYSKFINEKVNLIITCDCGISNIEEIKMAKNNIDTIITDHHSIPDILPSFFNYSPK